MSTMLLAVLAAIGFSGASLLALIGKELRPRVRSYSVALAAGILFTLAIVDLFPESLELAEGTGIGGFLGGFTLLFLIETFTSAHTHHSAEEYVHKHALGPFILGLSIHNFADGFVLGVSDKTSVVTSGLVGLGVLVHQMPVGISLAAVLVAAGVTRAQITRVSIVLGILIPLAAGFTVVLPIPSDLILGLLTGIAGGVLAYISTAHLLPEAQGEHPSRITGIIFVGTVVVTAIVLFAFE